MKQNKMTLDQAVQRYKSKAAHKATSVEIQTANRQYSPMVHAQQVDDATAYANIILAEYRARKYSR